MSKLTRWWDRRSDAARIELYTRWSFHFFMLMEIVGLGGQLAGTAGSSQARGWLFLLIAAHAVVCAVLSSRGLDWALDRRERPVRLAATVGTVSAAGAVAVLALCSSGALPEMELTSIAFCALTGFGMASLSLVMRKRRHMLYLVVGTAAAMAGAAAAVGLPGRQAVGFAIVSLMVGAVLTFTYGFSSWLLCAVWELASTRELQARLAVAEERLRFGRDLHDVMGRNLSVIALKSELAVQLAQRGRPEAVEQMQDVQRIAQESQREVQDVVRGYREADLDVELAGARSVLRAAGITCRVEGDDGSALAPGVQSALGWVVREAATNVLRHSDAGTCSIRLRIAGDATAVLVIENDGVPVNDGLPVSEGLPVSDGFPVPGQVRVEGAGAGAGSGVGAGSGATDSRGGAVSGDGVVSGGGAPCRSARRLAGRGAGGAERTGGSGGSGLSGLRERLSSLDGALTTQSRPGGVFRLTARIPSARDGGGSPRGAADGRTGADRADRADRADSSCNADGAAGRHGSASRTGRPTVREESV
ncbi:sensor histidine kinase [Streptomyces sp. bgisy100]|uniref:sensor histidine kinase n=1 Tax=Streptomyces sp. bgisy100 TaxID=3413783 RepID=UPI003D7477DB